MWNILKSVMIQSTQEQAYLKSLEKTFFDNFIPYLSNFDKPKTFLANSHFLINTEVILSEVINIMIMTVKLIMRNGGLLLGQGRRAS